MSQQPFDLSFREHNRYARRPLRPFEILHPVKLLLQDFAVQKNERTKRLILRGGSHLLIDSQMIEELLHLMGTHLHWMSLVMKEDVALDPINVGGFSAQTVMLAPNRLPDLVK